MSILKSPEPQKGLRISRRKVIAGAGALGILNAAGIGTGIIKTPLDASSAQASSPLQPTPPVPREAQGIPQPAGKPIRILAPVVSGAQITDRNTVPVVSVPPTPRPTESPKPQEKPTPIPSPTKKPERSLDEPVFYENLPDNNHCLQAAVMSVLDTLNYPISWDDINKETQYQADLYSWSVCAADTISKRIPGVQLVSSLDYREFAQRGEDYLKWYMRPDWFELQKQHASPEFRREQQATQRFLQRGIFKCQESSLESLQGGLPDNFLIALVNSKRLANKPGNSGHYVMVYKKDQDTFTLHDPGLPPRKAWTVRQEDFMDALRGDVIVVPKVMNK